MKSFFDKHIESLNEERRIKLNLSKEEFEKMLLNESIEAKKQEDIKQKKREKKSAIEQAELTNKRLRFAQSLGYVGENFHLATIVSIKHVNEFSGGTRRNNVVHVIRSNKDLLCSQKRSGGSDLSSDWIDDIELERSNITCKRCLKAINESQVI